MCEGLSLPHFAAGAACLELITKISTTRLVQHVLSIKLDSRSLVPDADSASKLVELGLRR